MISIRLRGPSAPARSASSSRFRGSVVTAAMPASSTPACGPRYASTEDAMYTPRHIAVRIERGGGTWPCEAPATSRKGTVPIPSGSNDKPGRCGSGGFTNLRPPQTPAEVLSYMPPESLSCKECRTTYPLEARYVCEQCFGPLEVTYPPRDDADPAELRRRIQAGPHPFWRYSDFLPVAAPPKGTLPAGWTPLLRVDRLAEALGLREVWIKNDTANPTPSFKARVVSVALARARELGFQTIACASTGNLANAVAAHAAAAGLESYVFVPANLEEQKLLATGVYGTNLVAVDGNYDAVNRLCTELSAEHEWAFLNINIRPYYAEGSKTLAFETAEQLGFELPDRVVCPVASGSLFTRVARGSEA